MMFVNTTNTGAFFVDSRSPYCPLIWNYNGISSQRKNFLFRIESTNSQTGL